MRALRQLTLVKMLIKVFISINGYISNLQESYKITVRRSGTNRQKEENISDAEVSIIDDDGKIVNFIEVEAGIYESDTNEIVGEVGKSYHLRVLLPDGTLYQSNSEEMPPPVPVDELSYEFVREEVVNELSNIVLEKRIKVFVANSMPPNRQSIYYKWEVNGEYEFRETQALSDIYATSGAGPTHLTCYLSDQLSLNDIRILDGTGLDEGEAFMQEIKTIPINYKFAFNYCVHVNQLLITKGAFEFWEQVQQISSRNGLFLDAAPGIIIGNIYNPNDPSEKVMGYFYTASIERERIFVAPDSVASPFSPCLNIDPVFEEACVNCLQLKGSRKGAPHYWPQ